MTVDKNRGRSQFRPAGNYQSNEAIRSERPWKESEHILAKITELSRKRSIIWRGGKSKKSGGVGTPVTVIAKRHFPPDLPSEKTIVPGGEVRCVRVASMALKKDLIAEAPKRAWKKPEASTLARLEDQPSGHPGSQMEAVDIQKAFKEIFPKNVTKPLKQIGANLNEIRNSLSRMDKKLARITS